MATSTRTLRQTVTRVAIAALLRASLGEGGERACPGCGRTVAHSKVRTHAIACRGLRNEVLDEATFVHHAFMSR